LRPLAKYLYYCSKSPRAGILSAIAFHEKAGRSQVSSLFIWFDKVFLLPSSHCRHASIRTLEERFVSLGACWASSIQPVLPSDWRPVVSRKEWNVGQAIDAVTGTRLLSFVCFTSWNDFDFVFAFLLLYAAAAAGIRLLLCRGSYTSPLTHR
jgi:hypothetical protein